MSKYSISGLFDETHDKLTRILLEKQGFLDLKTKADLQILQDMFQTLHEAPIRPMDAFGLNRTSLMNMHGLLLTFIFVLLQFRTM